MTEIYFQKMTPEGYREIEEQIEELKKDRPIKIARLKAARALGDLSENTEYSTAKRDLRHLESRLRFLNKQLTYAQIIQPQGNGKIDLGSTVTIEFLDDHDQMTYKIVGTQEADLAANKLAFDSPLGQAMMNQAAGNSVNVVSPGSTYQVKIISVN